MTPDTRRDVDGSAGEQVAARHRHHRRRAVTVRVVSAEGLGPDEGRAAVAAVILGVGVRRLHGQALPDIRLEAREESDLLLLVERDAPVQRLTDLDKRHRAPEARRPRCLERHPREVAAGQDPELVVVTAERLATHPGDRRDRDEGQQRAGTGDRSLEIQPLGFDRALHVGVEVEVGVRSRLGFADGHEAAGLARRVEAAGAAGEIELDRPDALDPADLTRKGEYAALPRVPAPLATRRRVGRTGRTAEL